MGCYIVHRLRVSKNTLTPPPSPENHFTSGIYMVYQQLSSWNARYTRYCISFRVWRLTICVSIHTSLRWKQNIEVIPRGTIFVSENYAVKLTRLYLTATLNSLVLNIPRPTITSGSARHYMRARAGLWFYCLVILPFLQHFADQVFCS